MFILRLFCLLTLFFVHSVQAFKVDTLSKIVSRDKEYIILSGEGSREFVYTSLTHARTNQQGEIYEEQLDPSMVSEWPVIIEPGEVILDNYDEVRLKITRNSSVLHDDTVIGLSFIPDKVKASETKDSGLQLSVGYKTWLFLPGTSSLTGDVSVSRKNNDAVINNDTNKILRVVVDNCGKERSDSCSGMVMSLPGTKKIINTPGEQLHLEFYTIDEKQKKIKELTL